MKKNAEVTVAARPVPLREASAFGVIVADSDQRIVGFQEKPKQPQPMPDNPQMAYVSMGNYIFNTDILINALISAEKKKNRMTSVLMLFLNLLKEEQKFMPMTLQQTKFRG